MAVAAALEVARQAGPDDVVVVLLPDGGRGYLSKIFNDDWMARYGFLRTGDGRVRPWPTCWPARTARMPQLVHVHPTETVRDAIDYMREYGVSQLPVLKAEPPVVTGEVAGSIAERDLLDALFTGQAHLHDMVERHMGDPLPMIGGGQPVSEAVALLEKADAAMVLIDGKPAGVLTRQDLLGRTSRLTARLPTRRSTRRSAIRRSWSTGVSRHSGLADGTTSTKAPLRSTVIGRRAPMAGPSMSRCTSWTPWTGRPPADSMTSPT